LLDSLLQETSACAVSIILIEMVNRVAL